VDCNVPRVVQFWRSFSQFEVIRKRCPEWFKVAHIALTVMSGSVASELAFPAMNFIKSDELNRLVAHLEACVQVYTQDMFTLSTFPYEKLGVASEDIGGDL
jgi:hypothetical protein